MLDFSFNRRDFLRVGGLGAGLGVLPFSDEAFAEEFILPSDKSVVWVWLSGGPTQFETFHAPTDTVPDTHRPVTGAVTHKNGLAFGGLFKELIKQGEHLTAVNSFSHGDSSHRQATHWMMTGHRNPKRENTADSEYPGHGAIASAVFGSNHPTNGMPAYVKQGKIEGEQPTFLGGAHKPFDPSNKDNLTPRISVSRFTERKELLGALDRLDKVRSKEADSFTKIGNTAYNVILGNAKNAFDLDKEPEAMREMYGKGGVGDQMLLARRLAQFGTKFITVHYGGWDMHGNIKKALEGKVPPIDKALTALINDIHNKGLNKNVLLIVTGEFGRTYKINVSAGRDHWPRLSPLMISGGDFDMGYAIGESTSKAEEPKTSPFNPQNLTATLLKHFGIDQHTQRLDMGGRPRYFLEVGTQSIL